MFHIKRFKWALRKILLPIHKSALVLDVGSGGNPYPRSDILLDRLTGEEHRCGESMLIDRQVVFADAKNMPFRDKSFDFVIASHILEHVSDPEHFLTELQRIGKAGYIETPNAIFERLSPYDVHCLEILEKDGVLNIHKKSEAIEDSFLSSAELLSDQESWGHFMFNSPELFHAQYLWTDKIQYKIHNPEVSCDWIEEINYKSKIGDIKDNYLTDKSGWRSWGLAGLNIWHKRQRAKRLKNFDLFSIMQCPKCTGDLNLRKQTIICSNCSESYEYIDGVPSFT